MKYLLLLLPFIMIACSISEESKNDLQASSKFEDGVTIGKELSATRYDDIYFSAQPSDDDIKMLRKQGFAHIINLRTKQEYDEKSERAIARKAGLSYTYAPFRKDRDIKDKYLDYIKKRV
ncbi:MAG: sulfur transferase domain-containing protein, partial [Bdellovibrionales bacterium]|nr:sulfur transferase domain-containing protein [Bdellovibrionales bacterium]